MLCERNYCIIKMFSMNCEFSEISEFRAKKLKFKSHTLSTNTADNNLIETLREMLSVHAPIRQRLIRGNQTPFMNSVGQS